jgi:hypothetical protein
MKVKKERPFGGLVGKNIGENDIRKFMDMNLKKI